MSNPPQLPTTFAGWVQFFEAGRRMTVPVAPSLLRRRIRGNRWASALAASGSGLAFATLVWLVSTSSGRIPTHILVGVLLLLTGAAMVYFRRLRGRLAVAEASPHYLELGNDGIVVAGTLQVPWERTVGVVAVDLRSSERPRRLGARLARSAGAARAEVVVGLARGTAKSLKAGTDSPLRGLIDAFSDRGSVRIPLDAVCHPNHVTSVLFAMCGAANVAGRESVLSHQPPRIRAALNKVMRSEPPINGLGIMEEIDATLDSASAPASTPSPR